MIHRQLQAKESNISSGIDWNDAYGRATVINIAEDILGRKWWSWVPVVADVSFSRSVIIHCGSSQVGWEDLFQLLSFLKTQGSENNRLLTNDLLTTLNMVRTSYGAGTRLDLTQLLLRLSTFESTDYRDRVAMALAVREQNTREYPPKSVFLRPAIEVQLDIAGACLGLDQSLNFLSLAGLGAEATSGSSSWLPELAYTQPAWKPRDVITQSSYRNLVFNPSTSARQDTQIRQTNTTVFNAAGALQEIAALPTITISPTPTLRARAIIIDAIQQIPSTPLGRSTPSLLKTWEILLSYFFGTLEPFQSLTDRWTARMTPHILNPTSKRNSPSYVECLVDGNKEHCELRRELFRKARDKLLESVPAWDSIRGPMRQRYQNSAPVTPGGNPTQEAYFLTILTSRTSSTQPSSSPDSLPPGSRIAPAYLACAMSREIDDAAQILATQQQQQSSPNAPSSQPQPGTAAEVAQTHALEISARVLENLLPHIAPNQRYATFCADFLSAVESSLQFRSLFVTRSGLLGLGPTTVVQGDVVGVLGGCKVPVVLRGVGGGGGGGSKRYRLVGETYVHGIMDGEGVGYKGWEGDVMEVEIV